MPPTPAILKPRTKDLGGFEVRRLLPAATHKMVGPFIFFDHMGPARFAAGKGVDVRPHPHIGLATVTYLFEGALLHRDSLGTVQRITPGDVNWMTAGRGIVHSERTPPEDRDAGPPLHGIQTWVALPLAHERTAPGFAHLPKAELPAISAKGVDLHVVAGKAFGERAPTPVFSDTLYVAAALAAGGRTAVPAEHEERGVYVVSGDVTIAGAKVEPYHVVVLPESGTVEIEAASPARLMLFGGERMDGDRHIWWNFVASSRELLEDAKARWREPLRPGAGRDGIHSAAGGLSSPASIIRRSAPRSALPVRPSGSARAKWIASGSLYFGSRGAANSRSAAADGAQAGLGTIRRWMRSPSTGSAAPTAIAAATSGCAAKTCSSSSGEILLPPRAISSFARPTSSTTPPSRVRPMSPVRNQPSRYAAAVSSG